MDKNKAELLSSGKQLPGVVVEFARVPFAWDFWRNPLRKFLTARCLVGYSGVENVSRWLVFFGARDL